MRFVPGELAQISPASVSTAASSSSSGTQRSTSPIASAASPSMRRAVNIRSLAFARPTRSGRRIDMPQIGTRPHWPWVSPNFVDSAVTRKSHARASSRPPVKQWPRILAIVGWVTCSRASTVSGPSIGSARPSPDAIASRSLPAQNDRPAPVSTTQRTAVSTAIASRWARSSWNVAGLSALSFSGRFSVSVATPSASDRSTIVMR